MLMYLEYPNAKKGSGRLNPPAPKVLMSFTLFALHCYRVHVGLGIP